EADGRRAIGRGRPDARGVRRLLLRADRVRRQSRGSRPGRRQAADADRQSRRHRAFEQRVRAREGPARIDRSSDVDRQAEDDGTRPVGDRHGALHRRRSPRAPRSAHRLRAHEPYRPAVEQVMAVPEGSQAPRRRFLSRLGAAVAAFGAGSAVASAQSPAPSAFAPARHPQDEWLTQLPGKHRIIIDAVSPKGAGEAVLYANNMYTTNRSAYSMDDKDLAIVIVMRHYAAPFALNDAAWAKYGELMAKLLDFHDPKTHEAPKVNLYNAAGYGQQLSNLGATIDTVTKKGAVIAICEL